MVLGQALQHKAVGSKPHQQSRALHSSLKFREILFKLHAILLGPFLQ